MRVPPTAGQAAEVLAAQRAEVTRRAAASLPAALARRELGGNRRAPASPRVAAERAVDGVARALADSTFEVAGSVYQPAAFFDWCRRAAWGQLARGRVLVRQKRGGRAADWFLEVSRGATARRTTISASGASAWWPAEFSVNVYPDREAMAAMAGAQDAWVAAVLLILQASGLDYVRQIRISGNPGGAQVPMLRGWFAW